ncbi:choice-of-anchor I family protein [Aquicoccus sp. SU-CL01552]|uniref:choice-of-anchor I family protein n=1 Tax=Aquicoccus sp. SU-CL01552 TaxID=3127656 RepID=UPI003106BE5A
MTTSTAHNPIAASTATSATSATSTLRKTFGFDKTGAFDSTAGEGGSEVVSHHDGRLYVTNGAQDRIDVFDIATGTLVTSHDLTGIDGYDGVNSVSASAFGIAVAFERDGEDGGVAFFGLDAGAGDAPTAVVTTGNLPDMVTFSKDGTRAFIANEGEPTDAGDPAGSISVIDLADMSVTTVGFDAFDDQAEALEATGVRLFPGKLPSTDFEPEYIAEGADGNLYVTLQEANAVAVFDPASMAFTTILPLGTSDHGAKGFGIDPSDKDDAIDIHRVPVEGLRMPDAIATAELNGKTYFLTANEGDDRGDYDEGGDAARVGDILDGEVAGVSIDPDAYTAAELADLARLNVSIIDGDTDGDGDIDQLHSYGARSFTIYNAKGKVVFDSGDDFEKIIARERAPNAFNNDDFPSGDADVIDENRSDNKGPEPEAIAVGEVDGKTLAFIGLERDGGIMVYDVSKPKKAAFVDYIDSTVEGDASPEVITFIAPEDSLDGTARIAVSYEVSGTTALYDIAYGRKIKGSMEADDLTGTVADDIIKGKRGADVIEGGAGNDRLKGGYGADTFVFDLGDGNDTIVGLNKRDKIDLGATGLDFADLTITDNGGGNFTVAYGDAGDSIDLTLTSGNTDLTADDFLF